MDESRSFRTILHIHVSKFLGTRRTKFENKPNDEIQVKMEGEKKFTFSSSSPGDFEENTDEFNHCFAYF